MTRYLPLILLIFSISCGNEERTGPPNIVFIMADDLGYEGLGVNGSLEYQTPNLDQMASDGMRFTHCYSQPVCTPTRVQIMTGRYNFRNYKQFGYLDLNEKTFAHYLQEAGYATAISGKWQLGNGIEAPYLEGFDTYCLWQIYNHVAGKDHRGNRYADPKVYIDGKVYDDNQGDYGPDIFTDFALDFIEENRNKPFFLYYPMILTHDPFVPTPASPEWSVDPYQRDTSFFKDMVEYTDMLVFKIRTKLDELDLSKDTYLFFTGDNGTHRSIYTETTTGLIRGGKSLTHEYGIHVPMIVYAPKYVKSGLVTDALFDFTDVLPTFLEIAGIEIPNKPKTDGFSQLPVLNGTQSQVRDFIYGYYWKRGRDPLSVKEYVRDHHFKYYRSGHLFDPILDPEEQNPLNGSEFEAIKASLLKQMNQVRKNPN